MTDQKTRIDRTTSRKDRRAAQRAGGRAPVAGSAGSKKRKPAWQSPMALLTGGSLLVGVLIIGVALFSSGQVGTDPTQVKEPDHAMPDKALWDGRALGPADAPVLVEAFEDYQCPACGVFSRNTQPELVKDYVATGKVRFVFKDWQFLGQESLDAAVAARCAEDQGQFWPYHEYLYANQRGENKGQFNRAFLLSIAEKIGLDRTTFEGCLSSQEKKDGIEAERAEGDARGVGGTPTIFVNGENVKSPGYLELKDAIDKALEAAQ